MRILAIVFLLCSEVLSAQVFVPAVYPKGYFRNPLDIPMDLSGNFGELRPNHYHMGLDLKTKARENFAVHAAADGYVARIKIEPAGFGRAIYVNHLNGYTTLYAHLNDFNPALEAWVKEQQYKQQSWRVFLDLPANLFPVKKGDLLAYSGNTGGSQAPHLHFEIRRSTDDVNLNPLLFGMPLADNVAPRILRMGIYDRTKSIYEQTAKLFPVKSTGANKYQASPELITVSAPIVSFGIGAFDTHTGSTNLNGIFESILYVDDQPVTGFQMDNISYNDTRYLNAHIDYKTKANGGPWLQQLFDLPGYINSIYKKVRTNGTVDLSDGAIHTIRIDVKDTYLNTATLECRVQYKAGVVAAPVASANNQMFYPLMLDGFEQEDCEFFIGERCLYDSVHIRYNRAAASAKAVSALHQIGASYIPLQEAYLIRIKPSRVLTSAEQQRTVMQWFAGSKKDVQKVEWQNNWASARFRDFGSYQLLVDQEPPQIVPIGFTDGADLSKATRIAFTVKDNYDKFKNVRPMLDGQWLRFTNDKGRTFIYRFDEKCPPGKHTLTIYAEDEAGNATTSTYNFTR
ncbi:M23 family metallopeptidase [Pseudoflavitalea sp. G-6-1-2]|uniref:M23 family metallopeptidase n=1 Tax=Pseudoflavitalea sp. G-6-1-2 TaxID=2728841 RepID=UPI00146F6A47|nr:peptidoglycan DD-metalloendopeptidase family protein [Pseudoflavitalea sp. G-6-1-2]NML20356.1 M23 family metallopeptidase [Pseudoflavitalea sp. G-6-1-2]